jgi:uncharacterized membrane protein
MTDAFWFWKTVHILSSTILLGAGLAIAFFCWFGYRNATKSGEIESLRAVLRLTVIADACLTAPAVVIQAVSGIVLMHLLGWPMVSAWSMAAWGLFFLVGLCWLPVVAIQYILKTEAGRVSSVEALPARFHRWFNWWFALGVPAFTAIVLLVYLMVAKPLPLT